MKKSDLAETMRERQRRRGFLPLNVINSLDDDRIIDSYITCSSCGFKEAEGTDLEYAIEQATDIEDFFRRCELIAGVKHQLRHRT